MKLPKIFLQQLPVSNNKKVWVNSVKLTMAGDDIASPAFNNSKLILKEQRKLLTRKKVDEDFWLAGFNNNKGEHGAKKETKTWLMSKSMHCLMLVFTFMSRSLLDNICWYSFVFMNLNSQPGNLRESVTLTRVPKTLTCNAFFCENEIYLHGDVTLFSY